MKESENNSDLFDRKHQIYYRTELSALYHRKRERFFALLDRMTTAFALIAGTAAFSDLLVTAAAKSWAGFAVAIVTIPELVFAWSDKARQHAELAQKFSLMQSKILGAGEDFNKEDLNTWEAKTRRLEAIEPPTLSGSVRLCQNQLAVAYGDIEHVNPLSYKEKIFVHFWDMPRNTKKLSTPPK